MIKVFVFKPTNEFLGKFKVEKLEDVSVGFAKFFAEASAIPLFAYLEAVGQTWTVVSLEPLQLQAGRIAPSATYVAALVSNKGSLSSSSDPTRTDNLSVKDLLHCVLKNQERQLEVLSAIRWAIIGFSIWFIIQFILLPKL